MEREMKLLKRLSLVLFVSVMVAASFGVASIGSNPVEVTSIHGETFMLHNHGIYRYDTVSVAMQAIAQDFVTILVWGSLFIIALIKLNDKSELSKLFYIGLLGYTLYAYISYTFLSHFNALFLVYVFNMSLSLYLFIRGMMLLDFKKLESFYTQALPIKRTISFMVVVAVMLSLMWLARLVPGFSGDGLPVGLETYHTLPIQAMDLGFIVPLSLFAAYYLYKQKAIGYALTSILLFKGVALFTAVAAMAVVQGIMDDAVNFGEISVFIGLTLVALYITIIFFKASMKDEPKET